MRQIAAILAFCLISSSLSFAGPPPWPKAIRNLDPEFKPVVVAQMPDGIGLYHHPDETDQAREKRVVHIASLDLNGDKVPELIVQADEGGSAGGYHDIYQKKGSSYDNIGWLGAGFGAKILSRYNGYYQLEFWSRGGGGDYCRELYRFERGKYRCVRIDDFRGYEGTYTGTRKPESDD